MMVNQDETKMPRGHKKYIALRWQTREHCHGYAQSAQHSWLHSLPNGKAEETTQIIRWAGWPCNRNVSLDAQSENNSLF